MRCLWRHARARRQALCRVRGAAGAVMDGMVRDIRGLKQIVRKLSEHGVRMTVNTDGPELYHTNVYKEQ